MKPLHCLKDMELKLTRMQLPAIFQSPVSKMVEILKALSYDPDILILDEPTATLTKTEVQKLHTIVKGLTEKGKTILFISHRMEEVFQFGDYATVLKDGKLVDTIKLSDVTENDIDPHDGWKGSAGSLPSQAGENIG